MVRRTFKLMFNNMWKRSKPFIVHRSLSFLTRLFMQAQLFPPYNSHSVCNMFLMRGNMTDSERRKSSNFYKKFHQDCLHPCLLCQSSCVLDTSRAFQQSSQNLNELQTDPGLFVRLDNKKLETECVLRSLLQKRKYANFHPCSLCTGSKSQGHSLSFLSPCILFRNPIRRHTSTSGIQISQIQNRETKISTRIPHYIFTHLVKGNFQAPLSVKHLILITSL